MTRFFLKALNTPGLILIAILGISIQTSLFYSYPLLYLQPDIVLLLVVWCGLHRDFTEGGILTLIISYITETQSGCPSGSFMTSYMFVFLMIRWLNQVLQITGISSLLLLTMFASVLWKTSNLLIVHFLGFGSNQWRHTLTLLLPGAVMQAIVGIWIYRLLDKLDWVTFKNPKAKKVAEDEYPLEEDTGLWT